VRAKLSVPVALVVVLVLGGLGAVIVATPASGSAALAPNFTLPDIYGQNFTLSSYRNSSVVVIEFTSLSCSECQIVEQSLHTLYSGYNQTGSSDVKLISIYVEPSFGDTIPALKAYHQSHNITWYMAQDTTQLTVYNAYGVTDIPTVFIINKAGQPVYDVSGPQSQSQLQATISSALAGTATAISIVTVSVFALAAIAGVTTFFSPCAFPMLPGYMGLFLGLNANGPASSDTLGTSYKGAARRALQAGSVSAMGMMIVFLIIGVALIFAASLISGYIPYFLVVVGAILIGLGALLLTNWQYWRIVTPFQNLWARIRGKSATEMDAAPGNPAPGARGYYVKLFSYGMGYAAAAAGCVAPVILAAIIAGFAIGFVGGVLSILIYSVTAALLMIVVTVMLALAGKKFVKQLNAYTPVIKKISAVALVVVGVYLIYFFYSAWIV
jgi:cytochrome c-type biogenesis protein